MTEDSYASLKKAFDERNLVGDDMTDEEQLAILRTIIGVKVLQDIYAQDFSKWRLAVLKSKKLIQRKLVLEKLKEVNILIDEFEISDYVI